jgi:uncharacterized membrane protein
MTALRTISLLGATITMGLITGAFALYAHTIMPALKTTDDRTFVASFQAMDRAIINPWFMAGGFVGALLFTIAATATSLGRPALPWVIAALALYGFAFVATMAVNVPLNDALKATGDRAQLHEARWAAWNIARTLASVAAFACLAWALVLEGRAS